MFETAGRIDQERTVIQREKEFFAGLAPNPTYLGILTNSSVNVVTWLYPEILTGTRLVYDYIQDEALDLSTLEGFTIRYLEKQYLDGKLIPDDKVDQLRDKIESGGYSKQYDAYLKYRRRMSAKQRDQERRERGFGEFHKPLTTDADASYNKRMVEARAVGMQTMVQGLYGETDYRKALLAELVLNSPFVRALEGKEDLGEQARTRHLAYFNEAVVFAETFDPEARLNVFKEETEQFPIKWTFETTPLDVEPFDLSYVRRVYEFAGTLQQSGVPDLDQLYQLLKNTILRRGRIFTSSRKKGPDGKEYLSLKPSEPSSHSFGDIAGYEEQQNFYKRLLQKTEQGDAIVNDIRMVIATGEPGRGKSLGVEVFVNNLPDNAKAILVRSPSGSELDPFGELAKLHPDLHIWAVIEDIDAIAGNRLTFGQTFRFLELDSAITDSVPPNLHVLATTNRPDIIDPAVIRPGRTAKILVYDKPTPADVEAIVRLHAGKNGFSLSNATIKKIAKKSTTLSPDEIRAVLWNLRFEDITNPKDSDIKRVIEEIKRKHKAEKDAIQFQGMGINTTADIDDEDELDDDELDAELEAE